MESKIETEAAKQIKNNEDMKIELLPAEVLLSQGSEDAFKEDTTNENK